MQGGTQQQQGRTHGGGGSDDGTGGGMSPDQGHDHDHSSVGSHSSGSTRSSRSSFSSHGSSRSGRSHFDTSRSGSDVGNRSGTDDTGADHGAPLLTAKHLRRGSVQQASAAVLGGGVGGSAAGAGASAGAGAGTGSGSSTGGIIVLKGKVVVVGDVSVGKTSIVSRFTSKPFNMSEPTSIGVAFSQTTLKLPNVHVNFDLWDTAGQERFRALNRMYYRSIAAGVAVYDVTSRVSFDTLHEIWLPQLREHCGEAAFIAIAANKSDLAPLREISEEEGRAFARRNNCLFVETSAKTGENVHELFEIIAKEAEARFRAGVTTRGEGDGGFQLHCLERQDDDPVRLGNEHAGAAPSGKCC